MRLCGERPYATFWSARMALRRLDPTARRQDPRVWRCAGCDAWHADGTPRLGDAP